VLARTHDLLAGIRRALDESGIPCRFAPAPEAPDAEIPGPATGRAAARVAANRRGGGSGARSGSGGGVELATFHRAKGLEWEAVAVVGLEEGFVPVIHASTPAALDEERRLLYVALTRAGRILECSWARSRIMAGGQPMARRPSPWLADVEPVAAEGSARPTPQAAAARFAGLRANLRG
jgi:superfamily I DNA/RNA helicase